MSDLDPPPSWPARFGARLALRLILTLALPILAATTLLPTLVAAPHSAAGARFLEDREPISAERIDDAFERVRDRHGNSIQWEIPEPRLRRARSGAGIPLPIGAIILWTLVAIVAIVLCVALASWIADRRPPRVKETLDLPPRKTVELSDEPLVAARAAAAQGRFEEAVHLLLLGTIEEIRTALDVDVPPWLTSREISGLAPIPGAGRPPLDRLIAMVEASYFGTDSIDEPVYEEAVQCHATLRTACERGSVGR